MFDRLTNYCVCNKYGFDLDEQDMEIPQWTFLGLVGLVDTRRDSPESYANAVGRAIR